MTVLWKGELLKPLATGISPASFLPSTFRAWVDWQLETSNVNVARR
jgi:hypothetical protein